MQREIADEVCLGLTVSVFDNIRLSSAIDRTASNYNNAKNKVKKSKRTNITMTLPDIFLKHSIWDSKECLKI